jgi:hypothetical protein
MCHNIFVTTVNRNTQHNPKTNTFFTNIYLFRYVFATWTHCIFTTIIINILKLTPIILNWCPSRGRTYISSCTHCLSMAALCGDAPFLYAFSCNSLGAFSWIPVGATSRIPSVRMLASGCWTLLFLFLSNSWSYSFPACILGWLRAFFSTYELFLCRFSVFTMYQSSFDHPIHINIS